MSILTPQKSPMSCTVLVAPISYLRGMTWILLTFVHFVKLADVKRNKRSNLIPNLFKTSGSSKSCYTLGSTNESLAIENRPLNEWRCISYWKLGDIFQQPAVRGIFCRGGVMYHLGGGWCHQRPPLKTLGVFGPFRGGLFLFGETPKVWWFYPVETSDCTPWVWLTAGTYKSPIFWKEHDRNQTCRIMFQPLIFRGVSKALLRTLVSIGEIPGRPKNPASEKNPWSFFWG